MKSSSQRLWKMCNWAESSKGREKKTRLKEKEGKGRADPQMERGEAMGQPKLEGGKKRARDERKNF